MKLLLLIFFFVTGHLATAQHRSINGIIARDGEFPYLALLVFKNNYSSGSCTASIIQKRWLLTAGHCDESRTYAVSTVTVGTNKFDGTGGIVYEVEKFVRHPNFNDVEIARKTIPSNDIMLVRVKSDIEFNTKVQPIKLPRDDSNTFVNSASILAGWGRVSFEGPNTDTLRYIYGRVIDHQTCLQYWKPWLRDHHICTSLDNHSTACKGDSGAPVVIGNTQIGIHSFGDDKCGFGRPNVHTRVSYYLPWIITTLRQHSDTLH